MKVAEININTLWEKYSKTKDYELRNQLITQYLWLVNFALSQMNLPNNILITYEDFKSSGILALVESIEKFDYTKGFKFETYATVKIKGKIKDELRKIDLLSRTARKKVMEIYQTKDDLVRENNREVSNDEIRERLNLTEEQFQTYLAALDTSNAYYTMSDLSKDYNENDNGDYDDQFEDIPDTSQDDTLTAISKKERREFILDFLTKLPRKKRLVITFYYYEELNIRQISQLLGITESRVSQIHSEVIKDLKTKLTKLDYV
ncbi:MAG: sigma-70 family RNA polymerase sigma factor [Candidatus Kapaibacteriota bacterium]